MTWFWPVWIFQTCIITVILSGNWMHGSTRLQSVVLPGLLLLTYKGTCFAAEVTKKCSEPKSVSGKQWGRVSATVSWACAAGSLQPHRVRLHWPLVVSTAKCAPGICRSHCSRSAPSSRVTGTAMLDITSVVYSFKGLYSTCAFCLLITKYKHSIKCS